MPNAPEAAVQAEQNTSPVATFRHRSISASVFQNVSDRHPDKTYMTVCVQKRYEKDGEWKNSSSYLRDELPVLEHLVRQAFAYILEHESSRPVQKAE